MNNTTSRPSAPSGLLVLLVGIVLVGVILVVALKVIAHEVHSVHIPQQNGGAVIHAHHGNVR